MITFSNRISIQLSIDKVFAFVASMENLPNWNYYIISVEKITKESGVGSRYHMVRKKDMHQFEIIEWKENEHITIQLTGKFRLRITRTMQFKTHGSETTIEDRISIYSPFPDFLGILFKRRIQNAVMENLEKLKYLLENGEVILQDGRRSDYKAYS